MMGRDRELTGVMLLLDDALAGGGRLVLCTGEAGIGKTRLAEEVAASAAARGVPVAWARAPDRDSMPPYGLWQLVLDEPAVRRADDGPSGVGLWSRVFGDAERPVLADSADSGSAQRFAMFAEVRRRLAQAARPSGCCWCLMICSGRTRRRRSCSRMLCASCEGRTSWYLRPTGSRRHPVIRVLGCCRVCRRMPTPTGWTFAACPAARSGACCSPPG